MKGLDEDMAEKTKKGNKTAKKRLAYIDIMNILAIFAVVILHHNGIVHNFSNQRAWFTSLVFECVFYFAVPIFVMISGAMLLNYREKYDTKTFFKKRVAKVLVPAIFWFLFMFVWKVYVVKTMNISDWSVQNILNIFFQTKVEPMYYFIFLILGLYMTMPILSRLAKPGYRKTLWYFVGAFFIMNALVPNLLVWGGITFNGGLNAEHGVTFGVMMGQYAMYAVLGYLLSKTNISKKYRIILYCLGVLAIIYRYIATAIPSIEAGKLIKTSWGYGQFHTIILASAVFVFVKNLKLKERLEKNKKIMNLLASLAGCSFGIYLIHKIIMYYEVEWFGIDKVSIWWRALWPFLTYGVSILIILLLKKIPVVKKVVP